jgi:hypothetical protein
MAKDRVIGNLIELNAHGNIFAVTLVAISKQEQ